jgi:DNA-binding PadR family transcriptional regulator
VTSTWDVVPGRRRRVYTLTRDGAAARLERSAQWQRFAGAVLSWEAAR